MPTWGWIIIGLFSAFLAGFSLCAILANREIMEAGAARAELARLKRVRVRCLSCRRVFDRPMAHRCNSNYRKHGLEWEAAPYIDGLPDAGEED